MTPPLDLAAIRARLEAWDGWRTCLQPILDHATEDIPALLAEVDRLTLCVSEGEQAKAQTLLDRWAYSGLPSVDAFNHAVDVANANYQRAERLKQEIARLREALEEIAVGDGWLSHVARAALTGGPA